MIRFTVKMEIGVQQQYYNTMKTYIWENKEYIISDEKPENWDLVLTENYGVWIFNDITGSGSAPLPYWANKNTGKKLIFQRNIELEKITLNGWNYLLDREKQIIYDIGCTKNGIHFDIANNGISIFSNHLTENEKKQILDYIKYGKKEE